ncbi:MAG: Ca2+-binding RTX toxin-like protein [Lentimonas sp.]|jgi:Ca2+-binding RTX toxin-like protein
MPNNAPVFVGTQEYTETRINTYTRSSQDSPSVSAFEDGGYVVVWESSFQDGSQTGIYSQRYSSAGEKVGDETLVNTYTESFQSKPAVSVLADGGYVIAWQSSDSSGSGVYSQRYSSNGETIGFETLASTAEFGFKLNPSISALADGGYVITWFFGDNDSGNKAAYQLYSSNGERVGGESLASPSIGVSTPSVSSLNDGGYVMTWNSNGQDGSESGIYSQRHSSIGEKVGDKIHVNTSTKGYISDPSVSVLTDGGYVIVWERDEAQYGPNQGLYFQRYLSNGEKDGVETLVNSDINYEQSNPMASALKDGGYVITWRSNGQDGSGYGIYSQLYSSEGVEVGTETLVNTYTNNSQYDQSVSALADGGYLIVWSASDGSGDGVYSQRFSADGSKSGVNYLNSVTKNLSVDEDISSDAITINAIDTDGDDLTYSLKHDSLPQKGNVILDQENGTYSYVPSENQNGSDSFVILVTDIHGATAELEVNVDVEAINDAPIISSLIGDFETNEDQISTIINAATIAASFRDVDITTNADVLTYVATFINGDDLPSWLVIDSTTGELTSSNPSNDDVGIYEITITASDSSGENASQTFAVEVNNVNDETTANDIFVNIDEDNSYIISTSDLLTSSGAFDIDGDALSINSAQGANNGTIILDNGNITFTPNQDFNGSASFTYTISDGNGGLITKTANLTIDPVNDSPIISNIINDVATNEGQTSIIITAETIAASFNDVDNIDITYGAILVNGHELPSWLSINVETGELTSNNPTRENVGNHAVTITATDLSGESIFQTFSVTVNNVNEAPIINTQISDQSTLAGNTFTFTIPENSFSDIDGDSLSYNASLSDGNGGSLPLPSWLTFDSQTRILSGNPPSGSANNIALIITASDGLSPTSQTFNLNLESNLTSGEEGQQNVLIGNDYNDLLEGGLVNDRLFGGNGDDHLIGNSGDDILRGDSGADILDGGIGRDAAAYWSSNAAINVNLSNGTASGGHADGDTLIDIESVYGSKHNDTITGDESSNSLAGYIGDDILKAGGGNDYIDGGTGNDRLFGGEGNDILIGNSGNDMLRGDAGADILNGGTGRDAAAYWSSNAAINVNLSNGTASGGHADGDTLIDIESVYGSKHNDTLIGDQFSNSFAGHIGNDYINGNGGNDYIDGGTGNDELFGGEGDDRLIGNSGNDNLQGEEGVDVLNGGFGNDTFIYASLEDSSINASDIIQDFEQGADQIDLSQIEDNLSFNDFEFSTENGHTIVKDKNSDFAIDLMGVFTLSEDDFIF